MAGGKGNEQWVVGFDFVVLGFAFAVARVFQIFGYVLHVLHVQDLSESVLIHLGFCFLHFLC